MTARRTEVAELIAAFQQLKAAIAALPDAPRGELVLTYAEQANQLVTRLRALGELHAQPVTEAEADALDTALSEMTIELHERFGRFIPPRVS